mmetsp:Transcript_34108/g.82038  ORF Transcript_34108/g.82038 Transcript_34108/m.82038 type:complete len:267 (+) Transcript_34108:368-1168(+)
MTLIHTPRVLWSIGKGLKTNRDILKKVPPAATPTATAEVNNDADQASLLLSGILPEAPPHLYHGRAGLFDVDYLGHMNNASSLTHAEYARWNWTAQTGMLTRLMKADTHFMVTSAAVRFRRQIRPFGRKFQVQTKLEAIDDDTFWVYQTFRYPELNNDRIRTQVAIKGVATQKGKVVSPRLVLEDLMDIPSDVVDTMMIENMNSTNAMTKEFDDDGGDVGDDLQRKGDNDEYQQSIQSLLSCYQRFDECFRNAAAADDDVTSKKSR